MQAVLWALLVLLGKILYHICFCSWDFGRYLLRGCQRYRVVDQLRKDRYTDLLKIARTIEGKKKDWYGKLAYWSHAKTKKGAEIFVLCPRGPKGETEAYINMWELLSFVLAKMDEVVVGKATKFAVVWVQLSDHRVWPWEAYRFSENAPDWKIERAAPLSLPSLKLNPKHHVRSNQQRLHYAATPMSGCSGPSIEFAKVTGRQQIHAHSIWNIQNARNLKKLSRVSSKRLSFDRLQTR